MGILSKFFTSKKPSPADEEQAKELEASINNLEQKLSENDKDAETHKALMITYNRALKVYVKCPAYRNKIDNLFEKIDELRNVIRRNI